MPHNQIVINVDIGETRVALIENGIVTELHIERRGDRDVVGNVYLGKVTRVLPGMNAAFVDIGLERAAFLHVEDAIAEGELRALAPDDDDELPEFEPPYVSVSDDGTGPAAVDEGHGSEEGDKEAEEVHPGEAEVRGPGGGATVSATAA